jgi:hypothetical protein
MIKQFVCRRFPSRFESCSVQTALILVANERLNDHFRSF